MIVLTGRASEADRVLSRRPGETPRARSSSVEREESQSALPLLWHMPMSETLDTANECLNPLSFLVRD